MPRRRRGPVMALVALVAGLAECDPAWLAKAWADLEPALSALLEREIPVDLA